MLKKIFSTFRAAREKSLHGALQNYILKDSMQGFFSSCSESGENFFLTPTVWIFAQTRQYISLFNCLNKNKLANIWFHIAYYTSMVYKKVYAWLKRNDFKAKKIFFGDKNWFLGQKCFLGLKVDFWGTQVM